MCSLSLGSKQGSLGLQSIKASNIFSEVSFLLCFFFLLAFSLHPLLLRCAAIDFWMIYVLFFIVASPSVAPVCARNLI